MTRPRLVLDTNIVISGVLFGGPPRSILELALEGAIELFSSPEMEDELEQVLRTKFPEHLPAIQETLFALHELTTLTLPRRTVRIIREDPSDNRILECALSAKADAIVSGDHHLLDVGEFRGIPILSPKVFLDRFLD